MSDNKFHITKHPSSQFSAYIDYFKIYHFNDDSEIKLNPDGHFEIIFQFDDVFLHNTPDTQGWEERPKNFVGGLHNKSYLIKPREKNSKLISIQFKANTAKHFIPEKLNMFKNKIIDINDVFSSLDLERLQRNTGNNLSSENLQHIDTMLMQIFNRKSHSPIDHSIELISQHNGTLAINQIANTIGLSVAQFRKRFNEEIGMSPKEYSKIIRVKSVMQILSANPGMNLTQLTYELGYFDQSHFIKDFQSVIGVSPKKHLNQSKSP